MMGVKRAILALFVCSGALFAQIHGVPPSVTSVTGRGITQPPVAPSVTSLGPRGFSSTGPFFRPNVRNFNGNRFGRGHHRGSIAGGFVYAYPYPVVVAPEEFDQQYQQPPEQAEQPEAPGLTIFDRRPAVRPAPNPTPAESDLRYDRREKNFQEEESQPAAGVMNPPARDLVPVVIVFKDGRQQEISNYAIVGDTLYELGASVAHKIKLDDLDLKLTVEKNEDRGVEFSLPANLKPKA